MIEILLALLPFVLVFVLMVVLRQPAKIALSVSVIVLFIELYFFWQMVPSVMAAATVRGVWLAVEILLIIVGALVLYGVAMALGCIEGIRRNLDHVADDPSVAVLVVGLAFGTLLEGVAGFGIPTALGAPLLMGYGFGPIASVAIMLVADSTPVSFGALGTPLTLGIHAIAPELVDQVTLSTAFLHALVGLLLPVALVALALRFKGRRMREVFGRWRLLLVVALLYSSTYALSAYVLGPVFPSVITGVVTLIALFGYLRIRPDLRAWSPYLIAIGLLLITRVFRADLLSFVMDTGDLFLTGLSYQFAPLVSPGIILLLSAVVCVVLLRGSLGTITDVVVDLSRKLGALFVTLSSAGILVQLVMFSGRNLSGLDSMTGVLGHLVAELPGWAYVVFSPFLGGLGSFIAGSNTVSNLLFGPFQIEAALTLGIPVVLVLALQNVGAAMGNMIAAQNILAGLATVGLHDVEDKVMRVTLWPCVVFIALAALVGLLWAIVF